MIASIHFSIRLAKHPYSAAHIVTTGINLVVKMPQSLDTRKEIENFIRYIMKRKEEAKWMSGPST